jgi:hypothetical protein
MAKRKKEPTGPAIATADQCGMRMFQRDTPKAKLQHIMTCTLPLGHEKDVHEEYQDGKWMGGWVDRVTTDPNAENWQQYPRLATERTGAAERNQGDT